MGREGGERRWGEKVGRGFGGTSAGGGSGRAHVGSGGLRSALRSFALFRPWSLHQELVCPCSSSHQTHGPPTHVVPSHATLVSSYAYTRPARCYALAPARHTTGSYPRLGSFALARKLVLPLHCPWHTPSLQNSAPPATPLIDVSVFPACPPPKHQPYLLSAMPAAPFPTQPAPPTNIMSLPVGQRPSFPTHPFAAQATGPAPVGPRAPPRPPHAPHHRYPPGAASPSYCLRCATVS